TEPCRPQGAAGADRRPAEADPQGGVRADGGQGAALHHRARPGDVHRARGVQRAAVRRRLDRVGPPHRGPGRERADLADPDLRPRLRRHLRLHHRRLGIRLEVLDPRLDAHVRAARLLRGVARALRARRRADGAVDQSRASRAEAAGDSLVLHSAVRRVDRLPDRRDGRDLTPAVRPPRGRHGARRRLPHRILGHALGPLPGGGVHQHAHALRPLRDALLRRLPLPVGALARPVRPDLVRAEALHARVDLHLAARDAAAPPLRPADAVRLEGAAACRYRQRARDRVPGGARQMSFVVPNTLKGFGVTLKQVFKKPITLQYPEVKRPLYPRYRVRHRLHKHENGLEKGVGCSLCAAACPADCIRVVPAENTPDNRVSAGERYARIYEINMSRCIFCGYCELACPFDAITLGNEFEISEYNRDDLIYTKDMLLAPPTKRVPIADPDLYDTPIPYYKSNS